MDWRAQTAEGWRLADESLDLMATGDYEEAIAKMREANRLRGEALEWRWAHDPPPTFLVSS